MPMAHSILWRNLDQPGHDWARLCEQDARWILQGTALFADEGHPCCLHYMVSCDAAWRTASAQVHGWVGNDAIQLDLTAGENHRWQLNGSEVPQVDGCSDVDMSFTPATNQLPIRRLNLPIGEQAIVEAAWLVFPSFTLKRLTQIYRRIDTHAYHYEAVESNFTAILQVNTEGFVIHYPDLWHVEVAV